MKTFSVVSENDLFGVKDDELEQVVVPVIHTSKEDAIQEWNFFQEENTLHRSKPFLPYRLSVSEIEEAKNLLLTNNF